MTYSEEINAILDISFDKILRIARNHVPSSKKNYPWIGLEHGVKVLTSDDELAQYLAAYGTMHREKIYAALDSIRELPSCVVKNISVVDWGCGQGLATLCFFDYLHDLGVQPKVDGITLIEPSSIALGRAHEHLSKYLPSSQIRCVNKYLNDVLPSDLSFNEGSLVVHFFSNILDIPTVNIEKLHTLIEDSISTDQLFVCVGPQNQGASRIEEFARLFDLGDENLIGDHKGKLSGRGTISLMTFKVNANVPEIIKVEYYHHRRTEAGGNTALNRVLSGIVPASDLVGKAMQFYRAAVSLERMKSTDLSPDCLFYYPYQLGSSEKVQFNIDIQDKPEFEAIFKANANRAITKWPKNLNIGLNVIWNNVIYRLFDYVYPFEDLKGIDISANYVSLELSMFTVNSDVAEKLELDDDVVEVITSVLSDPKSSLHDLLSILKDAIGPAVSFHDQLSLALTAEAPALAQINSEINSFTWRTPNQLLNEFLSGSITTNVVDNICADEIIQVVDMDDSQRLAITQALNSKVSVITGPPGTGKTQMVLNLLANAMVQGKSVLVASKNNKAVDNIKERFDSIDDLGYFQRFGSRDMVINKELPYLSSIVNQIPSIQHDLSRYRDIHEKYEKARSGILDAKTLLGELVRCTDSLPELEAKIGLLNDKQKDATLQHDIHKHSTSSEFEDILPFADRECCDWKRLDSNIHKEMNIVESKCSGLGKIFFNLFSAKKSAAVALNYLYDCPQSLRERIEREAGFSNISEVKNGSQIIRLYKIESKYIKRICSYFAALNSIDDTLRKSLASIESDRADTNRKIAQCKQRIATLSQSQDQLLDTINHCKAYIRQLSIPLLNELILERLKSQGSRESISRYRNYLPDKAPWKRDELDPYIVDARNFVDVFRLNSVTSLSIKNSFPLSDGIFDIVVIDEASQCDVASALPLLYRAKQLVVIGDPLQLKHITPISVSEEKTIKEYLHLNENPFVRYADYSLWDYCNDLITTAPINNVRVTLDCHYRCHPQIIGYSNKMFYQRKLGVKLRVATKEKCPQIKERGLIWVDVKGLQKSETRNVNEGEIQKSLEIAVHMAKNYPEITIGIISPFKHQAEEINKLIPEEYENRIVADTVHKFQGDEKDVIIYSLVVTDNSPASKIRWIDHSVPNLVNVAVTRARTTLYVVGNREYIRKNSDKNLPLGYLVDYSENEAKVQTDDIKETVIIDTNVFVNYPDILNRISVTSNIVLSAKVVDELDKLKVAFDDSKQRNVELAIRNINRLYEGRKVRMECADFNFLPLDFSRKNPDNLILSVALKYRNQNPILLTFDNGLQIKAKGLGIRTGNVDYFA